MFPFWDIAIGPILDAVRPTRVAEIGALRGDTTKLVLDRLGDGVEFHVIDPLPGFDPDEHARAFPGRYIFHRDLSLNALVDMDPMDVALIDGDHNWYTVLNEMKMLAATAANAGAPLPVMLLHDVCWPYGRRDLYYDPSNIPAEHRQPFAKQGIVRGQSELDPKHGVNPTLHNATHEGGPRNGVLTGVDDFIAQYDGDLKLLVLPVYFGLAIVVDRDILDSNSELATVIDHLESPAGAQELFALAESERLRSVAAHHELLNRSVARINNLADRYLDQVKATLIDEHYLENELRIVHLLNAVKRGVAPQAESVRDPLPHMRQKARELRAARRAGEPRATLDGNHPSYLAYTPVGRQRLDLFESLLQSITRDYVNGHLVDVGAGRGGVGIFFRAFLEAQAIGGRQVWLADRFHAYEPTTTPESDDPIQASLDRIARGDADLNMARESFSRFDLLDKRVRFLEGDIGPVLSKAKGKIKRIALLRLGETDSEETFDALTELYPLMSENAYVVIDRYDDPKVRDAVDRYREAYSITEDFTRADNHAIYWRKKREPIEPKNSSTLRKVFERVRNVPPAAGAPLVTLERNPNKDLSVVVCFYNMKREAQRTLLSLSRSYQRDIDGLDYEVIVVENGSSDDEHLGEEFVTSFGREFRYLDMGTDARPSPVFGLNEGLKAAGGAVIAVMIDGAHVLTPGVLHYGMSAMDQYKPAVTLTQQFYMGPGQQGEAMVEGYDQAFEDRLFKEIHWPQDGYQLFKAGHFIGGRDWFDGQWESNCLFIPRELLDQVGGFDESFDEPGGGFANLEFYERLASSPNVKLATMLGEGSFHQMHGGTTTNEPGSGERRDRIMTYAQHFVDLRGKGYFGPRKPMHFVGTIFDHANRTRGRRRTAMRFFTAGAEGDPDGPSLKEEPIPEDVETAFIEAYWRNHGTQGLTWLGHQITEPPTDLFAYQRILTEVKPDWVIEAGTGNGSRALFLASIFDLIGHGQVVSIDTAADKNRPVHPRIQAITADALSGDGVRAQVDEIIGDSKNTVLVLGGHGTRKETIAKFDTFADLVPVGSYVIVESTIVGGHPVWPTFGAGPVEGVKAIVSDHPEFGADPLSEPRGLTYNPGGYLRRNR